MTEISNLDEHIEIAEEIVFSLGKILRNRSEDWLNISTSSEHDIKLVGDKKAEDFIFNSLIKKSPFPIFGEETGWKKKQNDTLPYWIIDPIDGTVNYLRNIPICCISIALMHKNRPHSKSQDVLESAYGVKVVICLVPPRAFRQVICCYFLD